MLSARYHTGFTIIELLIGMAILAILVGLGAPAMGTYLQNSKLAAATANFYSGVQAARTEAIRRNIQSQFVLTDLPLTTANLANDPGLALATGRSWVVRSLQPPGNTGVFDLVDQKSSNEGEGSVVAPSIVVASTGPAGYGGAIPFNGFGGTFDNQRYQIDITNPAAGACAPGGPVRCRRIVVSPGGQIHVCDTSLPLGSGDTRACPTP